MGWRDKIRTGEPVVDSAEPKKSSWRDKIKTSEPERVTDEQFAGLTPSVEKAVKGIQGVDDALGSVSEGLALGGAAQKAGEYFGAGLGALTTDRSFGDSLKTIQAINAKDKHDRETRSPKMSKAGEVLAAAASPTLGKDAVSRVMYGIGTSAVDKATRQDSVKDAIKEGVKAGGTAGVLQTILESLGAGGKAVKAFANRRAVKSLDPTLAQQASLMDKGQVQELGDELLETGVTRFGSSVEDMAPRLEDLLSAKGKRIGEIRDAADAAGATVDFSRLAKKGDAKVAFSDATNEAAQGSAEAYAKNAGNYAKVPTRNLREAQEEVMSLNQQIPFKKDFPERTPAQQAFTELRSDITGQMDDQVRQKMPQDIAEYLKTKGQFSLFKGADEILDKAVARSARNNDISIRDLLVANTATKGKDAGDIATSATAALATKLARERGNAALAVTSNKVSQLMQGDPQALGKYAAPLMEAAKRGNKSFLATHLWFMKNDPEYAAQYGDQPEPAK